MKFYELSHFADYGRQGFCFTDKRPQGIDAQTYRLAKGIAMKEYPEDSADVTLQLDDDHDGLKKGSIVGNSSSLLIMDKATKQVVADMQAEGVEYFLFHLLDHKGRVHSKDYFFVNPLRALDCINRDASVIKYRDNGDIKVVRKMVLDAEALSEAPHLFRISPIVRDYYISEALKDALEAAGTTNLVLKEVPVK